MIRGCVTSSGLILPLPPPHGNNWPIQARTSSPNKDISIRDAHNHRNHNQAMDFDFYKITVPDSG